MPDYTKADLEEAVAQLELGREYITDPNHWTVGAWFRGQQVCSLGALERITGKRQRFYDRSDPILLSTRFLACAFGISSGHSESALMNRVASRNDGSTHQQVVLAVWDKAIKLAKESLAQVS